MKYQEQQSDVGIKSIGIYIPEGRVDNIARCADFGKDEVFMFIAHLTKVLFVIGISCPQKHKNTTYRL